MKLVTNINPKRLFRSKKSRSVSRLDPLSFSSSSSSSESSTSGSAHHCISELKNLEEFGAISSAFESPACDSELREAFDFFDSDHDGRIMAEELHAVFAAIGDEQCTLEDCRRMISGVDKNMDGFVCFRDFARMMEQQR